MSSTNRILEQTFHFTLDETNQSYNEDGQPYTFLTSLAEELVSENNGSKDGLRLEQSTLERAIMCRLLEGAGSVSNKTTWPVQYLIGCHRRSMDMYSKVQSDHTISDVEKNDAIEVLALSRQLSVSYVGFMLQMSMFPQPEQAERRGGGQIVDSYLVQFGDPYSGVFGSLIPEEVRNNTKVEVIHPEFLPDYVSRFEDDNIGDVIEQIGGSLINVMSKISILGDFSSALSALMNIMANKVVAAHVCNSASFLPGSHELMDVDGRFIENKTILGAAFGISSIPDIMENPLSATSEGRSPDVAEKCFPGGDAGRKADIRTAATTIQTSLDQAHTFLHRIIMTLLKNQDAKIRVLDWFAAALTVNKERTKMRPDMKKASTDGFMLNVSAVLLRLCRPFLDPSTGKAWSKLDVRYLSDSRARGCAFDDDTRLGLTHEELQQWTQEHIMNEDCAYHFICECFFLTGNALRLSIFKALENCQQLVRAAREYDREASLAPSDPFMSMRVDSLRKVSSRLRSMAMCFEVSMQQREFLDDFVAYYGLLSSYLPKLAFGMSATGEHLSLPLPSPAPKEFLSLPEYLVENLCMGLTWIGHVGTQLLTPNLVEQFMLFFAFFLGSNDYVKNPYLRGKMVETLSSYMPKDEDRDDAHPWSSRRFAPQASQEVAAMINAHPLVVENLVKALVLLFVEIERTDRHNAFYEKFSTRYQIGEVMIYLWDHPGHRQAWTRVVENDPKLYVRFVNMMINDSQHLLQEALEALPEVRDIEMQMADEQTWHALPNSTRDELTSNLDSHRRHLLSDFGLSSVYLKLMEITSDDPQICARFFDLQVRDRQARILNFFLRYMTLPTERKRLKLKNPEKYGWKPRELLSSLARIHANLFKANNAEWAQAVAADTDYYGSDPSIFEHLISILSSLGAPGDIVQSIDQLRIQAAEAVKASAADDENFEDAPEEFEDPLSCRIMKDPVKLPSGQILDRTTILQHLLTDNRDPFSREMMTEDDLEELPDLKNRILQWMDEQRKPK